MDTVAAAAFAYFYARSAEAQTGGGARRRARTFVKAAAQRVGRISKRGRTKKNETYDPKILPQAFQDTFSAPLGDADHRRPRIPGGTLRMLEPGSDRK